MCRWPLDHRRLPLRYAEVDLSMQDIAFGSVEMSFPLGLPEEMGIKGHTFTDFGTLWEIDETGSGIQDESSIRAAAGIGVSWRSPFGPIRLDLAVPYAKEDFDEEENFRFDFGTRF